MESLQQLSPYQNKEIAKLCSTAADGNSFKVYQRLTEAACGEIILILKDPKNYSDMSRDSTRDLLRKISASCNNLLLYAVCVVINHPYHLTSLVKYPDGDDSEISDIRGLLDYEEQPFICIGSVSISPLPGKALFEPKPEPKAKTPLESLLFL